MGSLRRQLSKSNIIAVLVAMIAFLWLTNYGVNKLASEYILSRLQHDAESIVAALEQDEKGTWHLDENRVGAVYGRVHSGHYYHVSSRNMELPSRSLWDHTVTPKTMTPGQTRRSVEPGIGTEMWFIWQQGFEKKDEPFTLWVAEDIQPLQRLKLTYSTRAIALVVAILTILLIAQQWILSRGFRPLEKVRASIAGLHDGNEAALHIALPDEVKPLIQEIDRLLLQLHKRVTRSRNSLGNLAHELKRPVQRLRLLAESLDKDKQAELFTALNQIQWRVERELKRARIVGVSSPGRHTVLEAEIPGLIEVLERIYPDITLTASWPDSAVLPHDRDDVLELLGNLLDNACQHARDRVELEITAEPGGWVFEVRDNGPGIPADQLETITERGTRLDETGAGTGLGLAICNDIVTAWSGTLTLEASAPGGLKARIKLPAEAS